MKQPQVSGIDGIFFGLVNKSPKDIDILIVKIVKDILPLKFELGVEHIKSNKNLCNLMLQLHGQLPKILTSNVELKATYLMTLGLCLNNKVAMTFVPESFNNVKDSVNLQKISLAYCKTSIAMFNHNSIQLNFKDVNELNYYYNVIETNLNIISSSSVGNIHEDEQNVYKKTFLGINSRVNALIKRSPDPHYFKLQALLWRYIGDDQESLITIKRGFTEGISSTNLSNIADTYYREQYKNEKHPVVIYTI